MTLTRPLSTFIGRAAELRRLVSALLAEHRLVTLVGPAGHRRTGDRRRTDRPGPHRRGRADARPRDSARRGGPPVLDRRHDRAVPRPLPAPTRLANPPVRNR